MVCSCAGIGFQKLFKLSRQKFLVSAAQILKTHLTEFRDHGLLKEKCDSPIAFRKSFSTT